MTDLATMSHYELHRHKLIKTLNAQEHGKAADMAIILWEQMAAKIISIIGEKGFHSLYVRSVFLNVPKFSWLATYNPKSEINNQFLELKACFELLMPEQVKEANNQLLITLTDILASLIGAPLTTNILWMAWGDIASDLVTKEFDNE
ncbi:MAG: hypothetical protein PSV17_11215 [Methylotenera sp.]|uniref:hypothetical protein n=1 Tax=Methylotenera sp. TaxID=2051956 RepID=UPI0024876042|nr:hypothetical protein [Methylotenera sp.]MDI1309982.1 hypothetical protein [Methylotenera sp.]